MARHLPHTAGLWSGVPRLRDQRAAMVTSGCVNCGRPAVDAREVKEGPAAFPFEEVEEE